MAEVPRVDYIHYLEIIQHDEVLERFRRRVAEVNDLLVSGELDPKSDEYEMVLDGLSRDWPYQGEVAELFGRLRIDDSDDVEVGDDGTMTYIDRVEVSDDGRYQRDAAGLYHMPDGRVFLRSDGIEIIPHPGLGTLQVAYLFSDVDPDSVDDIVYCFEGDADMSFARMAPEAIHWQLEQLVPEVVAQIDAAIDPEKSLIDRLRGLSNLTLQLLPEEFADFALVDHVQAYIDARMDIDHRVPYNLTLKGEISVDTKNNDGSLESFDGELERPIVTPGIIQPILLVQWFAAEGEMRYTPIIEVYTPTEDNHTEHDDELRMPPETIQAITSTRPRVSLASALRLHSEVEHDNDPVLVSDIDGAEFTNKSLPSTPEQRDYTPHEKIRYYQRLIDAARELTMSQALKRYATQEEAAEAAKEVGDAVVAVFEDDLDEMFPHTFIASGVGVHEPTYARNGFDEEGSNLSFWPLEAAYALSENAEQHSYFVQLMPGIFPTVMSHLDDETQETYYTVDVSIQAQVNNKQLFVQGVSGMPGRIAKRLEVTNYVYVSLSGSAELEHIRLHDMREFTTSLRRLESLSETMPRLEGVIPTLKKLQRALFDKDEERTEFTELNKPALLTQIGRLGAEHEQEAKILAPVVRSLFGPSRLVSLIGEVYKPGGDKPVLMQIAGVIEDVTAQVDGQPGSGPSLVIKSQGADEPTYAPLEAIQAFYF